MRIDPQLNLFQSEVKYIQKPQVCQAPTLKKTLELIFTLLISFHDLIIPEKTAVIKKQSKPQYL